MANRLEIVPVGVVQKSSIVVGVVLGANTRLAVTFGAELERGGVERVDLLTRLAAERDVDGLGRDLGLVLVRAARANPERRLGRRGSPSRDERGGLHLHLGADGREDRGVELLGGRVVRDGDSDVVEHCGCGQHRAQVEMGMGRQRSRRRQTGAVVTSEGEEIEE